ncbi:MAG: NrfD/PsrC family molybdoenzyme membrane anchor subunit [Halobacteriales archaeon]|nr:NrfD/PsrC family molybdoenzyme membrane anchor subunit [Halobacteriales archaeon]
MSMPDAKPEDLVRPITKPSKKFFILGALASVAALIFVVAYAIQLENGLEVTNLSDWGSGGGVTWGTYIGTFIWWVGIAHGGIIISAAVRLLRIEKYEPVARIAELLTIGALTMAGLMIVVHLGRPDRVVWSVVKAYPTTVHTSPLAWDLTVITLYFVLTATYLSLTLRSDVYRLRDQLPDILDPLYSALLFRYDPDEDPVVERMAWWLALAIIILAPLLLHGGVIPWLFALTASTPGWFGGLTAPQFLSAALTSAMGGVLVVAFVFRTLYENWESVIPKEVIWGLGWWMGIFSLIFVWLQLQRNLTGSYAAPTDVAVVTSATQANPAYWTAMLLIILPLAYVAFQHFGVISFSMKGMVVASIAVILGVLIEKTLFTVEGLLYPATRLYGNVPGAYSPTPIELASILGTTALLILFFMLVSKLIPIVELKAIEHHETEEEGGE